MKWYHSGPVFFLWCILCGLLGHFTRELDIPSPIFLGVSLTFAAAITVYSATDFRRKFPDLNSKIGYAVLFLVFALAYGIAQTTL